jgi:hypothetical protein
MPVRASEICGTNRILAVVVSNDLLDYFVVVALDEATEYGDLVDCSGT